jgi:low temperature requirement protein LtrA
MPPVLRPPRLRSVEDAREERHASWFELFFDLVFVAAVAVLGDLLTANPSSTTFLEFAALFVPVWWAWVGYTFYADRFDTDDLVYRILMMAAMLSVAAVAVNIRDFSRAGSSAFVLSYVAMRCVLMILYARAGYHVSAARDLCKWYLCGFALGAALWLFSLLFPSPWRYALWAAGLAVEIGTPLSAARIIARTPIHYSHIPERLGLLTIIVLGETVLSVTSGVAAANWSPKTITIAVMGFAVAACLWWIYFDFVDTGALRRGVWAGQAYLFSHLPLVVGLTAFGAGVELAITRAGDATWAEVTRLDLCGGLVACMASLAILRCATGRTAHDRVVVARAGVALVALGFLFTGTALSQPVVLAALLAAVILELVGEFVSSGRVPVLE